MILSFRLGAAALVVCALAAGACGKKPPAATPTPQPPPPEVKPTTTPPPPPAPTPPPPPTPVEKPPVEETIESLTKSGVLKPVFFAYDSIVLSEEARAVLQKNAEYLKNRPTAKVMVEGHADSRGTNEYNLALSDRRAASVRDYLVSLGIAGDRISSIAKGEEQPFCKEEMEACWQQNRVGYFVFTAK
jgi:peptidoglycan-associated lipoprotein